MVRPNKTDAFFRLPVWYRPLLITLTVLPLVAIIYWNGWIGYTYSYVSCGFRQPVIAVKSYKSFAYKSPGDPDYSPSVSAKYYCTIDEAYDARTLFTR